MRKILSHIRSHIYDVHAIFAATLTVFIMYLIKKSLKRGLEHYIDKQIQNYSDRETKRGIYYKRYNLLLIVLAMCIAFVIFSVLSFVSPMIHFSFQSAIMSGIFALCGDAFFFQITFDSRE